MKDEVFLGVKVDWGAVFCSKTKIGLAREMGISVKSVERAVTKGSGKWVMVKSGGVIWNICSVGLVQSGVIGNAENFKPGHREKGSND